MLVFIQSEGMALGPPRIRLRDGKMNFVGARVTEARLKAKPKITQDQMCARIADITRGRWTPIRQDIYKIEQGTRLISDLEMLALAAAVECEASWLLYGDDKQTTTKLAAIVFEM